MLPKSLLNAPSQRDLVYESVERVYGGAVDSSTSQMIYQRKCCRGTVNHHREIRGLPPSFCWQGQRQPQLRGSRPSVRVQTACHQTPVMAFSTNTA